MTLQRKTRLRAVTPINRTSTKARSSRSDERKAKARARVRCQVFNLGRCEVCALQPATDFAHRLAKSRGGEWSASNGLMTCRACHDVQRDGRGGEAVATRLGQVIPSLIDGKKPDPEHVPVHCAYGWVYLLADGGTLSAVSAVMST